jgi:hypothetical protein
MTAFQSLPKLLFHPPKMATFCCHLLCYHPMDMSQAKPRQMSTQCVQQSVLLGTAINRLANVQGIATGCRLLLHTALGLLLLAVQQGAKAEQQQPINSPELAAGQGPAQIATSESPWSGTLELYGFAPLRSTGSTTINGLTANYDLSFADVLPSLQFAAAVRGRAEYDRTGLLTDLSYVNLGNSAATLVGRRDRFDASAGLNQQQGIYDVAVSYRLGARESAIGKPGQYSVIPYAGVRIINMKMGLDLSLEGPRNRGFSASRDYGITWAQPLIGTQASLFLSPKLRIFARGDIGGFGLSGDKDLSGNAQVGLGYAIGNNTDLNLSWRYLGIAYDSAANRGNSFDAYQNGVELGVKFFF